jgi:hypothetical protein
MNKKATQFLNSKYSTELTKLLTVQRHRTQLAISAISKQNEKIIGNFISKRNESCLSQKERSEAGIISPLFAVSRGSNSMQDSYENEPFCPELCRIEGKRRAFAENMARSQTMWFIKKGSTRCRY